MSPTSALACRTVLVTGAASGIGRATVEHVAIAGANVIATDRDIAGATTLAAELSATGLAVIARPLDVTSEAAWPGAITNDGAFDAPIDGLVLNAGVATAGGFTETTLADWRAVFAVNLDGVFLGLKHGLAAFRRAGVAGRIVITGSAAGGRGSPAAIAYAASKAALDNLVRSAALEGAKDGITVNLVAPGGVDTPIWEGPMVDELMRVHGSRERALAAIAATATPLGRFAKPEEIAATIGFLLSPSAGYFSGARLVQDGGYLA